MTPLRPFPKLLAVDPGSKRVGLAVSDELGMFAHPREAIVLADGQDAIAAIEAAVAAEGATELVLGLPIGLSGRDTAQTQEVRLFAAMLRQRLSIPVTVCDERLSSVEAARSVTGADRRRRGELDSAAATIVLQSVLDTRRLRNQQGRPA